MAKRNITDDEIALIKAMIQRGMKNKDIQFFFNRPDRAVNSGRITDISKGIYSNSEKIDAVSEDVLGAFLANYAQAREGERRSGDAVFASVDPLDEGVLKALFKKDNKGIWRLTAGESDEHECKAAYGAKYRGKWLRAVAALANNRGGYLFFGVHDKDSEKKDGQDKSYELIGMPSTEFQDADPKDIFRHIKAVFDPTPRVRFGHGSIDGKSFGLIYVDPQQSKPVIARQGEGSGDIREGDIFFRYPGSSERIKYSDLRAIMDERDAQARSKILPMVERLLAIGPEKALIADLNSGVLTDGANGLVIDTALVEQLTFIKEGEFSEVEGAMTLRLLGDIKPISADGATVYKNGIITKADLIRDFLREQTPYDPKEYLRFLVEGTQAGEWLPLNYFARRAGLDPNATADFIDGATGPSGRKRWYRERALGKTIALAKATGAAVQTLSDIEAGKMPPLVTADDVTAFANAIRGLLAKPPVPLGDMLKGLDTAIEQVPDNWRRDAAMTALRKAICRLDDLYFGASAA